MKPDTMHSHLNQACDYLKENGCGDVIILCTMHGRSDEGSFKVSCESGAQALKLAALLMNECMDYAVENCDVYGMWKRFFHLLLKGIKRMEKETGEVISEKEDK